MGNLTKARTAWWDKKAQETEANEKKEKKAIMSANVGDGRETVKVRGTPLPTTPRQEVTFVDLDEKGKIIPTSKPPSEQVRVGNGKKPVKVRK